MALIQPRPVNFQTNSADARNRQEDFNYSVDERLSSQHVTILDLRSKNLKKIDKFSTHVQFNVVRLDSNQIIKLENLDVFSHLIELSVSENRLIDIRLIGRLKTLKKVNLSNNSIDSVEPLKSLTDLLSLNVASNNIDTLSPLIHCRSLEFLDASDNSLRQIEDFSQLNSLKFFNLHKNLIDHLNNAGKFLPKSLHSLILSDNEINDLTEISFLAPLNRLRVLKINSNPCLNVIDDRYGSHQPFDHRSFVFSWCPSIENLDDSPITRRETSKAEWLLTQGKIRSFKIGEHFELVQFLTKTCPTNNEQTINRPVNVERRRTYSNETLPPRSETSSKVQRSLLISESEFVEISPGASFSPNDETKRRTISDLSASHTAYTDYDNRPIKPLNQRTFQTELNQYPIDQTPTSSRLSPKSTSHGPTASIAMQIRPRTRSITQRVKRHTIAMINDQKIPISQQKFQSKSKTNKTNPAENQEGENRSGKAIDPMTKTSMLQAYLELHQHFRRTTELHTSALISLWEKFEEQKKQNEKLAGENEILKRRLETLEKVNLHPPIRVHISKRDGKSFFLNWTPHPESSDETIDGYRIFIDDVLRITSEKSQTQAVIDCIREEGDYKLKVRSFNKNGESADSNVTIIRFRRQKSQNERSVQSGDDSISTSPNFGQSPASLEENILLSKPPSPPGAGLMSRLIKQSVKVKRNNVLLNGLPLNSTEIVNKPVASSSDFSGQNSNKSSNSF